MNPGERFIDPPSGVHLAPLDAIPDGGARNFVLQMKAGRFHGFVIRHGNQVFGYRDRCPHMGLPLAQELDDYLTADGGSIVCAWHGALFEIESGRCVGGPCPGTSLSSWPVIVEDGIIRTA